MRKDPAVRTRFGDSCLDYFAKLWQAARPIVSTPVVAKKSKKRTSFALYISSPHLRTNENKVTSRALSEANFESFVPYAEVKRICGTATPSRLLKIF
jgi:hypothetical protein